MTRRKIHRITAAALAAVVLSACSGDDDGFDAKQARTYLEIRVPDATPHQIDVMVESSETLCATSDAALRGYLEQANYAQYIMLLAAGCSDRLEGLHEN